MDAFDELLRLRDLAQTLDGITGDILRAFGRRKPTFDTSSGDEQERRAQRRAHAKNFLSCHSPRDDKLRQTVADFWELDDAIQTVREAVGVNALPIVVGTESYPTAHEAVAGLGEAVLHAWEAAGADYALENAPDRLHSRRDDANADLALESCDRLWKRLRRVRKQLRKQVPGDFWGRIQQEFAAASLICPEPEGGDDSAGRQASTVEEADAAAKAIAKKDPEFAKATIREQRIRIMEHTGKTCSLSTLQATPFREETKEQTGRTKSRVCKPKVVELTEAVEETTGSDQEGDIAAALAAAEERPALEAIERSGMKPEAKLALAKQLQAGEITIANAMEIARQFPYKKPKTARLCRQF